MSFTTRVAQVTRLSLPAPTLLRGGTMGSSFSTTQPADHANITVNRSAELVFAPGFFGVAARPRLAMPPSLTMEHELLPREQRRQRDDHHQRRRGHQLFRREQRRQRGVHHQCGRRSSTSPAWALSPTWRRATQQTGMTAGSIAGAGTYNLGSKQLTVGSNNTSTTVSGTIEDDGRRGWRRRRLAGQGWHGDPDH